MNDNKIVIARLWQKGFFPNLTRVTLHFNRGNFKTICIYLDKKTDKPDYFEQQGCDVEILAQKGKMGFFNPLTIWKLVKLLRINKVDILHCHRHKATIYGTIAAKIAGVPIVYSHVHSLKRTRGLLRRLENKIILNNVTRVLTIGEAVRKDVLETNSSVSPEKVVTVGLGIDFKKYADVNITKIEARKLIGVPLDAFVFGTVGRLAPVKGHGDLINAFAKVRKVLPDSHLVIVGRGRLENQLKQQAIQLGCENAITFTGFRTDLPQVLRAFDCFVFPSISEGVGAALLEAMAASLPCIGCSSGGIAEILDDRRVGTLVEINDVATLTQTMMDYAKKSEQERAEIGANAKERVRQFYNDEMISAKFEDIYLSDFNKIKPKQRA